MRSQSSVLPSWPFLVFPKRTFQRTFIEIEIESLLDSKKSWKIIFTEISVFSCPKANIKRAQHGWNLESLLTARSEIVPTILLGTMLMIKAAQDIMSLFSQKKKKVAQDKRWKNLINFVRDMLALVVALAIYFILFFLMVV